MWECCDREQATDESEDMEQRAQKKWSQWDTCDTAIVGEQETTSVE